MNISWKNHGISMFRWKIMRSVGLEPIGDRVKVAVVWVVEKNLNTFLKFSFFFEKLSEELKTCLITLPNTIL